VTKGQALCDVIVIGAGPAGSILAYELAKRGLEVLVLEKATLPRYVACGGGLALKTVQRLPFGVSPVFELEVVGGIVTYSGRRVPLGGRRATLHRGRVLLVGDAGNLASPFLGEGIYYAVVSAQIAAEVMAEVLARRVANLEAYTARVNAEIVRQLACARHSYIFNILGGRQ
jgi:flavin-dependent dehydrogenase